jgi:hypothetical protein
VNDIELCNSLLLKLWVATYPGAVVGTTVMEVVKFSISIKNIVVNMDILTRELVSKICVALHGPSCCLRLDGCWHGLLFRSENEGSMFLRNVIELLPDYISKES